MNQELRQYNKDGNLGARRRELLVGQQIPDELIDLFERSGGRVIEQQVPHGTQPEDLTDLIVSSLVQNERNHNKSYRRSWVLDGTMIDLVIKFRYPDGACMATTTLSAVKLVNEVVPNPPGSFLTVESRIEKLNRHWAFQAVTTVESWPTFTDYAEDSESGARIKIEKTMVAPSSEPTTTTPLYRVEQKQINCDRSQRTTLSLANVPASRVYRSPISYEFPSILIGWNTASGSIASGRSFFLLNAIRRTARQMTVCGTVEVDYFTTAPACDEVYNMIPQDISYNGLLFNIAERGVLCDAVTLQAITGTEDDYYGNLTETASYTASTPSATTYLALVAAAAEVLVASQSLPWEFNLYRRERVYIRLR